MLSVILKYGFVVLLGVVVAVITATQLTEGPGTAQRPWRIAVIALSLGTSVLTAYLGISAGNRFRNLERSIAEANQRAWDAQRKAKTFTLSAAAIERIASIARAIGPAVGDVQLNCTPGEENDHVCNALNGALVAAGWRPVLSIGATLWGGSHSPALVLTSTDQRTRGEKLAEALRNEGIRAEARPIEPEPKSPMFIIAITHP